MRFSFLTAILFVFALPLSITLSRMQPASVAGISHKHDEQDRTDSALTLQIKQNVAHAAEVSPVNVSEGEVPEPTWGDKILAFMTGAGGMVSGLVILFEILCRAIPSMKPKSLLVPARYACVTVAAILTFIANVLGSLINVAQSSQAKVDPLTVKKA